MDFMDLAIDITDASLNVRKRSSKVPKADRKSKDLESEGLKKGTKFGMGERKTSKIFRLISKRSGDNSSNSKRNSEFFTSLKQSGVLLEIINGKERSETFVTLDSEFLRLESDKRKSNILLIQNIISITASNSGDQNWPYSFDVGFNCNNEVKVLAAKTADERSEWMQNLIEIIAPSIFPGSLTTHYTRVGSADLKFGNENFCSCWLILVDKILYYWLRTTNTILPIDVSCATNIDCLKSQMEDEKGMYINLETNDKSIQILTASDRETTRWWLCLKNAPKGFGTDFLQNQITVILDKCTEYISTYGINLPRLYEDTDIDPVNVAKLFALYKSNHDIGNLHLDKFSPYDVAVALKRFFSEFTYHIFSDIILNKLLNALYDGNTSFKDIIRQEFTEKYLTTARKLFGHFYYLNSQNFDSMKLATIWSPALVSMNFHGNGDVIAIINELIRKYPRIFEVDDDEIRKETEILTAVQQFHRTSMKKKTPNKNINIWISIGGYFSENTAQVLVYPETTVQDVYKQFKNVENMTLQEFVLNGAMYRPLHPCENLYEIILSWSNWDENDRRDNQLVLAQCPLYLEIKTQGKPRCLTKGELKYADSSTKYPLNCEVEMDQVNLYCNKRVEKKCTKWRIKDIVWYIGSDPKRDLFSRWTITFLCGNETPRNKEYFGNIICGSSKKELYYWCAGFYLSKFPGYLY